MTPLKIHMPLPPTVPTAALADLLTSAGLTASSTVDWIADCPDGDRTPVVLVVIPNDPAAGAALEVPVRAAMSRGERVIAVWPPGAAAASLPASLEDYGASLIEWDPAALHAAICGAEPEWQDAGGGQREAPVTSRNKNC